MNRTTIFFLFAIMIISASGCKKKSGFDPLTKTQDSFIGSWKGVITAFKDNQNIKQTGLVVFYLDAGGKTMSGILFAKETSVLRVFQFLNGTIYFKVENSDPENPKCKNWSLSGYANFIDETTIDLRMSGNECGNAGNEYISWAGNMASVQVPADSVKYFNFGKQGNNWQYGVNLLNGDTCQLQRTIVAMPSDYFFTGNTSQACAWGGMNWNLKWGISPDRFTMSLDSSLTFHQVVFPINAKIGVSYKSVINSDTTAVTLLDTNLLTTTPAGNFICYRFLFQEQVPVVGGKTTRSSVFWINNRYGIVRQEVNNPVDSTGIKNQSLVSKNF